MKVWLRGIVWNRKMLKKVGALSQERGSTKREEKEKECVRDPYQFTHHIWGSPDEQKNFLLQFGNESICLLPNSTAEGSRETVASTAHLDEMKQALETLRTA